MSILEQMEGYGHEQVVFARDPATGLRAIIAVHSTTLGPALGGTRIWNYASEQDALYDVLRLSQGMTMKNAAAGLPLGGGKAVIIGDVKTLKTPALLRSYAGFIKSLGGRFYTAEDVNCGTEDIDILRQHTDYVVGSSGASADPSPFTARGVLCGMRAGLESVFGSGALAGRTVAVQGLGNVGYRLCAQLHDEGAKLIVSDVDEEKVRRAVNEFGAKTAEGDILLTECDVLAPCALGAVITEDNAGKLQCGLVAGSANNILATPRAGEILHERGVLYLPDYIINAGGVINCGAELVGTYSEQYVRERVEAIYDTTASILAQAKAGSIPTYVAADRYAMGIIEKKH